MAYLVVELQRDALNSEISTTNLLRKALVVAKKLKLTDFEEWINFELNGYKKKEDIPKYRIVYGQLKGWNPYNGWVPTLFNGESDLQDLVSKREVYDPISEIEYLMNGEQSQLCFTFPAGIERQLGQWFQFETKYQLFVTKSKFQGILESIRTTILNWSLELECDGILGEEMVFSDKEKEIASERNYTVNNFYGPVSNSQIQQNSTSSQQSNVPTK